MTRDEIQELYYFAPIENLTSIMRHGILSHNRASRRQHLDFSDPRIQERRRKKKIPGGRCLHDYVNLYFNPRNKMMFAIRHRWNEMVVLRISSAVLDLDETIVSDRNASSDKALFLKPVLALRRMSKQEVFVRQWHDPDDLFETWRLGSIVCAEVLHPDILSTDYIRGAYVASQSVKTAFDRLQFGIDCEINSDIFFR